MSFIPYQIDYQVTGTGKTLGVTKKRIIFKFGFANRKALSDGLSGSGCRGSEHEVVLIMSLASGKRNVVLDGREVHFSQGANWDRTFDFPFSIRVPGAGSVHARLIADSAPGAKPFDFLINGMSYFHFSKIYELGTPKMRVGQLPEQRGYGAYNDNDELAAPPEERRLIAQAKLESLRELRAQKEREQHPLPDAEPKQMDREEENLINFDDDLDNPPPQVPAQTGMMYHASSITLDPALQSPSFPSTGPAYQNSTAPAYQNYSFNTPQQTSPTAAQYYGYGGGAPTSSGTTQYSEYSQPQSGAPTSSMLTHYSQPAPAPYTPSPYAQAPPSASYSSQQSQPAYGYPQQSFQAAPAPTFEDTQMAFGTPSPAPQQQQQYATTPQSQASYGSAPAFAQPPQSATGNTQPNGMYGAYPNNSGGW